MTPNPTAPRAYYAEAIDRRQSGPRSLGYQVVSALADRGVTVYRPATTWRAGNLNPDFVEQVNRTAMLQANVIVADLSDSTPTLGVPMEIEACTARGIPAVVLWDGRRPRSVSLMANPLVQFVDLNDHSEWVVAAALADKLARQHWETTGRGVECAALKFTMAAGAEPPQMAFADDAGFDLVTAVDTEIPAHSFVDVPTTITGVQCPPGTWLLITGRSSTVRKRGLLVPNGVIDTGWRGPLFAGVYNLTGEPVVVRAGERVAQAILQNGVTEHHPIRVVDTLDPHPRGLNGFGSTGGTGSAAPEPVIIDYAGGEPVYDARTYPEPAGILGKVEGGGTAAWDTAVRELVKLGADPATHQLHIAPTADGTVQAIAFKQDSFVQDTSYVIDLNGPGGEPADQDRQGLAQKVGGWINPRRDEVFPINPERVEIHARAGVYTAEHGQAPEPGWASEGEKFNALG